MNSYSLLLGFLFFCLCGAQVYALEKEFCPPEYGALVIGSFFHKDNRGPTPDYCEYHIYDKSIFSVDSKALNGEGTQQSTEKNAQYNVIYKPVNGEPFAQKKLDFSSGYKTPSVVQHDSRSGEMRKAGIRQDGSGLWDVSYQKKDGEELRSWEIASKHIDVNDAGFVQQVRSHWDSLLAGETIRFDFLSIPHGRTIKMSAKQISSDSCEAKIVNAASVNESSNAISSTVCIKVSISNFFFRLIAPALWLSFDRENQQLDIFTGIVNIRDEEGENQTGSLFYEYF